MTANALAATVILLSVGFLAPSLAGYERYVITGGSMSGSIERGAVVFAETVPVSSLEVGDVITYQPPAETGLASLVTHRIVEIRGDQASPLFRTKGDANADPDPWTFQLGGPTQARVVADVPVVGHLFLALADRTTRMLLVGVPAAALAALSLVQLARALRRPGTQQPKTRQPPTQLPAGA